MPLRFAIRDLLWLTLVVGLIAAWSIDHWTKPSGRYRLVETKSGLEIFDDKTNTIWIKDGDHWSTIRGGHRIAEL
jgi:hypothetical protein